MGRPSAGNAVTTEDEVNDLQRRISLLEGDRKMFYETSQWTIKQNKETLELVKEENKHFKEALALLQRDKASTDAPARRATVAMQPLFNDPSARPPEASFRSTDSRRDPPPSKAQWARIRPSAHSAP